MGDATFEIQLGTCFYGGLEEDAPYVGRKPDESGWISVCEEHKQQAEGDGYELMEPKTQAQESPGTGGGAQTDGGDRNDDDRNDDDRDDETRNDDS